MILFQYVPKCGLVQATWHDPDEPFNFTDKAAPGRRSDVKNGCSSIPSCTRFKCTRTFGYYYVMLALTSKHTHKVCVRGSHLQINPPTLEAPTRGNAKVVFDSLENEKKGPAIVERHECGVQSLDSIYLCSSPSLSLYIYIYIYML